MIYKYYLQRTKEGNIDEELRKMHQDFDALPSVVVGAVVVVEVEAATVVVSHGTFKKKVKSYF